ncbi:hypothetical protein DJ84_12120 [Halorubrum ezzemoulense]|nr:hypothetical protein DJ84_12120 [Halorubrum ezzemoulense]
MNDETYDGPGTGAELSLLRDDDVVYLLSHHRKRIVLLLLAAAPHSRVHLQQVAQTLTALEEDSTLDRVETSEVRNRRRNLKRSHLKPLLEAGVIREADASEVFLPGPAFSAALAVLVQGGHSLGR